jgi:urease accessory protein
MSVFALIALADGRFPAGGHAHSGGMEAAVADGRVTGPNDLRRFLLGRLRTVGLVEAALAAATVARGPRPPVADLAAEADARCASPALRAVNCTLGRQLLRSALVMWPDDPGLARALAAGVPLAVAQGAVALAAGIDAADAAAVSAYQAVTGPATAAVRLLGIDPRMVHGIVVGLGDDMEDVAAAATAAAGDPLDRLPGSSSTLLELAAERHARAEVRLFAS